MSVPIDPTDVDALYPIYEDAYEKAVGQIPFGISPAQIKATAIYAVACAVCPEHHSVYDTRTHVAVPLDTLTRVLDSHDMRCGDDADIAELRSLIPGEASS